MEYYCRNVREVKVTLVWPNFFYRLKYFVGCAPFFCLLFEQIEIEFVDHSCTRSKSAQLNLESVWSATK